MKVSVYRPTQGYKRGNPIYINIWEELDFET